MIISAGASAPGVSANSMSMPSMRSVSRGFSITRVGAISPRVPGAPALPSPASTCPRASRGSSMPNW